MNTKFHLMLCEMALLAMIILEPPGPLNSHGKPKTVSSGITAHPGFAFALLLCVVYEFGILMSRSCNYNILSSLCWALCVGYVGIMVYPETTGRAHLLYATIVFISSFLVVVTCVLEGLTPWYEALLCAAAVAAILPTLLIDRSWLGTVEVVYLASVSRALYHGPGQK